MPQLDVTLYNSLALAMALVTILIGVLVSESVFFSFFHYRAKRILSTEDYRTSISKRKLMDNKIRVNA